MNDHPFKPSAHVPISCAVCGQEQRFHAAPDDLLATVKAKLDDLQTYVGVEERPAYAYYDGGMNVNVVYAEVSWDDIRALVARCEEDEANLCTAVAEWHRQVRELQITRDTLEVEVERLRDDKVAIAKRHLEAEAALAAQRQRHAEAVEQAFTEAYQLGRDDNEDGNCLRLTRWDASEAKAALGRRAT